MLSSAAAAKSLQSCPTLCDPMAQIPTNLGGCEVVWWFRSWLGGTGNGKAVVLKGGKTSLG